MKETKHKIIPREKWLKKYVQAYREGAINMGFPTEVAENGFKKLQIFVDDLKRIMELNGMNFVKNERAPKLPNCVQCKKKVGEGALRLQDRKSYLCRDCILDRRKE